MRRRRYLSLCGALGSAVFAGCSQQSIADVNDGVSDELQAPQEIVPQVSVTPQSPLVGEQVVFDASESTHPDDEQLLYFWTAPEYDYFFNEGPTYQRRFEDTGNHAIEVWITGVRNVNSDADNELGIAPRLDTDEPATREAITVDVTALSSDGIDVRSTDVNIQLRADQQSTTVDSLVRLTFSATNFVDNDTLEIQLIAEIPSGLVVDSTTYEQGGGQFSSVYEVDGGETINDQITVGALETGPYSISAAAVYEIADGSRQVAESDTIQLRFFE